MKGALLRNISACKRNLLIYRYNQNPNPIASSGSTSRFYSSKNNLRDEPRSTETQKKEVPVGAEDVSDAEMKKLVARFRESDVDVIPLLSEATRKRIVREA